MIAATFAFLLVLYLAWIIGANSVAMAVPLDARRLSFQRGAVIVSVFCLAGVLLFGEPVRSAVRTGVLGEITFAGSLAVGIAAAIWLTLSTWKGMPISSTHTLVGAIAGYGLLTGRHFSPGTVSRFAAGWIVSPLLGIVSGFFTYLLVRAAIRSVAKGLRQREAVEDFFNYLYILAGALLAFSLGSNALAAAMGAVQVPSSAAANIELLAAIAICLGVLSWGRRVALVLDRGITELIPSRGFCAFLPTALIILFFSGTGTPVSVTHIMVGSIVGVGLARGINQINVRTFTHILFAWFITVPVAAALAAAIYGVAA